MQIYSQNITNRKYTTGTLKMQAQGFALRVAILTIGGYSARLPKQSKFNEHT